MATAVGRSVEIPIILCSLADSMAVLPENELPLAIHPNFLATLNIGAYEEDKKCQVVKGYNLSWWTGQKPRDLDTVKILDQLALAGCITHYHQQQSSQVLGPSTLVPPAGTNSGSGSNSGSNTGSDTGISIDNTTGVEDCTKCPHYHNLLSDDLQDIVKFHNFSNAMATTSEMQWNQGMQRTATFHLFHEAALLKETAGTPTPTLATATTTQCSAMVHDEALTELCHLQALPPSSHKWTWGEQLTEQEVLRLR